MISVWVEGSARDDGCLLRCGWMPLKRIGMNYFRF